MNQSSSVCNLKSVTTGRPTVEEVDEALGMLGDGIAALANVEALLRSPRISSKALDALIPNLPEHRPRVTEALITVFAYLRGYEALSPAIDELEAAVVGSRERYGRALSRASLGLRAARERLAFENELSQAIKEFRTGDVLARLLLAATRARPTDLELRELIEQAFLSSRRTIEFPNRGVMATVASSDIPWSLHASPAVLMPLITLAVGVVHEAARSKPSLRVEDGGEGSLLIIISDAELEGDALMLSPPAIIPPVISCVKAAAKMARAEVSIGDDEREVILTWPKKAH